VEWNIVEKVLGFVVVECVENIVEVLVVDRQSVGSVEGGVELIDDAVIQ